MARLHHMDLAGHLHTPQHATVQHSTHQHAPARTSTHQ
jgi:hypothetical protein